MSLLIRSLPLVTIVAHASFATVPLSLSQFTDCIGYNTGGYDANCVLESNTYPIGSTLPILRSNISLSSPWPYATLQRVVGFTGSLMDTGNQNVSGISIGYLNFDGSYSRGAGYSGQELSLSQCSSCSVNDVVFSNSHNYALSVNPLAQVEVSDSYFENIAYGGIYSGGSGGGRYNQYWCLVVEYSTFTGNGVGGIVTEVKNGLIIGNTFSGNHATCPYSAPGGQIDLDSTSDNVDVQNNTFNNGPSCSNGFWAQGVELHGTNLTLTDNDIENNAGEGIYIEGAQNVNITSTVESSAIRIADNNRRGTGFPGCGGFPGIRVHSAYSASRPTQNITIQNIWSIGGQSYGVEVSTCGTSGPPVNYITIQNNCVAGNISGGLYTPAAGSPQTITNNQTSGCGGY